MLVPAWCAAAVGAGVCVHVIIAACLLDWLVNIPLQGSALSVGQKVVLWSLISQVSACSSLILCKLFHLPPVKTRLFSAFIHASVHFPQHLQAGAALAADLSEAALAPRQRDSDPLNTLPKDIRLLAMLSVASFPSSLPSLFTFLGADVSVGSKKRIFSL